MLMLLASLLLAESPVAQKFTANLLVTNQPGTVFMRRQQGATFELASVNTARRGEPVGALVLFSACGLREDGSEMALETGIPRVVKDSDKYHRLVAGVTAKGVPPGEYRLRVTVQDAGGRDVRAEAPVRVD